METCDRRSDYIEKVANLVYIYKQFVDRWIFKYNSNFYYDPNMSDCDDTQFNQLYIILKSILAKASIVPILAPTNIPLI